MNKFPTTEDATHVDTSIVSLRFSLLNCNASGLLVQPPSLRLFPSLPFFSSWVFPHVRPFLPPLRYCNCAELKKDTNNAVLKVVKVCSILAVVIVSLESLHTRVSGVKDTVGFVRLSSDILHRPAILCPTSLQKSKSLGL